MDMNFLPRKSQILFKKQYKRKVFVFLAAIILFLLAVNLILLFPSYLFLKTDILNLKRQLEIASQSPVSRRFEETRNALEKLNSEIDFLNATNAGVKSAAPLLKKITDLQKKTIENISIDFISFEKKENKITLQGAAETRTVLLQFINSLENEDSFFKIQSPPSNLLKEKNINYSLNIFLK